MSRTLVVTHSSAERDGILWLEVLKRYESVDLVIPMLPGAQQNLRWLTSFRESKRVFVLPAIEPIGGGHASLWIHGLRDLITKKTSYSLLHAAMEPWALTAQYYVDKIPTVVHGAESVLIGAPKLQQLRRSGLRRVLRHVVGLAAWGHSAVAEFVAAGLPSATPRAVIPMGVPDSRVFTRTPIGDARDGVHLLYVGRLVPEKGVDTLLLALSNWQLPNTTLRILGTGPDEKRLRSLANHVKTVRVQFEGTADINGVKEAYRWSHIVVVPSRDSKRWKEQWGRVAVEAMMSGRVCISSDSGELPYIQSESDAVFAQNDYVQLRAILERLILHPQELLSLANAQYRSTNVFNPAKLAIDLNSLWSRAVSK